MVAGGWGLGCGENGEVAPKVYIFSYKMNKVLGSNVKHVDYN